MLKFMKRGVYALVLGPVIIAGTLVWMLTLGTYHPLWDLDLMFWVSSKGWQH